MYQSPLLPVAAAGAPVPDRTPGPRGPAADMATVMEGVNMSTVTVPRVMSMVMLGGLVTVWIVMVCVGMSGGLRRW